MHNGMVSDFAKIKRNMGRDMTQEAFEHIQGGTDTEHIAALFMSYLCPDTQSSVPNPYSDEDDEQPVPAEREMHHTPRQICDA